MSDDDFALHLARRGLFGSDVAAYDAGRPRYPERVFEILVDRCGLMRGSDVIEIGPGTGQATTRLLDLGARMTVVDLDATLLAHLEARFADRGLQTINRPFEDVELAFGSFDLVVAATSFHWVPTERGVTLAADALRSGGWLAVWWNVFGDVDRPDPFNDALTPILERMAPELLGRPSRSSSGAEWYGLDVAARISDIDSSHRFGPVHHEVIPWTGRHTAEQLRALFASFSPWLALPVDRREVVLDAVEDLARGEFDGVVERPYLTPIYVASRLA